uniref:Putative adenosine monophosphate deaminase n=1 Tax=Trypanosoma congolense (strain IL3000) TaxID=1068625 RepID=G0UTY0_TRYCI|nr:putative adenosine monophosphate deaminase [Trypanosoma congolense IL3000]
MASAMTQRQLLNFIGSASNSVADDIVAHQDGIDPRTLPQRLHDLQISPSTLTGDDLYVQVDAPLGGASAQYTPGGRDVLCPLLLSTDYHMKGRYFAELTKLTFENFEHDRFTFTENRLPIYGASSKEWELLSDWFDTHGMASVHNRWMVPIPRIHSYLRERGKVQTFAEYIENIFKPLWTGSLHPSKDPRLFHFINHISGFDCVEDERRHDAPLNTATRPPHEWTTEEEPPYNYYMYHVWANIYSLNEFRRRRKFSTFSFRPSCGETGPVEHLIGGFLLANAINYGVTLADDAPLQYLFYLARIGVTVSPLSNNTKVLGYLDNPFPTFFRRGLNVSLGTDSPLMFHHTQEPLLEEYSIASKVWKLSPNDMCEIARNSVLLSGFDANFKRERLGDLFFLSSSRSNDASHTHLSDIRVAYRFETYHSEISLLEMISSLVFPKALLTLSEESALEAQFRAACEKEPQLGCIIEVKADDVDMNKLQQNRDLLQRQLDEVGATVDELRRQNKQLTEKLAEERARDQQAQALRRRGVRRYEGFLPPEEGRPGTGAGARFSLSIRRGVAPGDELVEESGQEENSTNHMNQQQQETGLVASPRAQPANPAVALARASCQSPANSCPGVLSRSTGSKSAVVALVGMSENMWSHSETRSEGRPAASGEDNTLPPINDDITPANDIIVMTQRRKCSQPTPPPPKRGLSRPPLMLPEALDEVEAEDDAEDNSTVMD